MMHSVYRKFVIRGVVIAGFWAMACLVLYLISAPSPWIWSSMLTMIGWTMIGRHVL